MKIVCDNCATKYSIADEKVRGKVFKIRCKKCSHIIVVRGGADGNVEASRDAAPAADGFPGPGEEAAQTVAARGGGAAATGDAVWHLVIDREQVGPMTPIEVRTKFSEGAIDVETYAWREGFGDWLRLGSIEDFRDLGGVVAGGDEGSTRRTDAADLFAAAGGSDDGGPPATEGAGDLFGGGAATPGYAATASPSSEDVFGGGGALFSAPSSQPAPARQSRSSSPGFSAQAAAEPAQAGGGVAEVRPMTGQRNENSVLFSLNNLQALATGGGGAKAAPSSSSSSSSSEARPGFASSQSEGSGLIDIRAMAASTLAASPGSPGMGGGGKHEDLPGLGAAPVFSPMAAPILMPAAPSGPPKWMWAILSVGVAAVLGIVVVGILLLTKKGPEPQVAVVTGPAATAPAAAAPAAAAPAAAAPTAAAPAAANAAPTAVAAADSKDEGKKHHAKAAGGTKLAKNDAPKAEAAAAPPPAAPAPAAPAPKKSGGKHDELDDLLNGASPGDAPKPHKKAAAAADDGDSGGSAAAAGGGADLPDQLDKGQIVGGMGRIKGRVAACYDQFKVPGMANVSVTITNSGRVGNANVGGAFSGTPTGDCVSRAVKSATFPRFKGSPQTINYPFILR